MDSVNYPKVASFKTVEAFREYLARENIEIGLDEHPGPALAKTCTVLGGHTAGNRWAVLPMEGWDCGTDGTPGELTRRRWLRFAASGAKLIFGTEAAAVMHTGRSNPHQLMAAPHTEDALRKLCAEMRQVHKERFGTADDLVIGLQLTHSGRYSHPNQADKLESVTAYAHPLLDKKFHCTQENVIRDEDIPDLVRHFVQAAKTARNAGFDFVDIKHAHGYLAHEFLSAVDRKGPYGGSFENRTRLFREIVEGIHKECPGFPLAMRLSIFDILPFVKGEDGAGHPMPWQGPYPYAFGGAGDGMNMDPDLAEPVRFVKLAQSCGIDLICASIGSPYYNVHMQRPAYYAVSDGYPPPENPLYNVSRHLKAVRRLRKLCPGIKVVGSGYTCLQEFLPAAAEYAVKNDQTDFAGIGRMVLSYPDICADVQAGRPLRRQCICRTFGECTNAPRAGMISGCYPLDEFYKKLPEAALLRARQKQ